MVYFKNLDLDLRVNDVIHREKKGRESVIAYVCIRERESVRERERE